jgi:hypothetical protein
MLSDVSNRVDWVATGHSRRQLVCRVHSSIWMRKCCFERHFLSKSTTHLFCCWWQGVFCVVIITSLLIHFLGWLFGLAGNGFNIGLRLEKNLMRRNHVFILFFFYCCCPLVFFPPFLNRKKGDKSPRGPTGRTLSGRPAVCREQMPSFSGLLLVNSLGGPPFLVRKTCNTISFTHTHIHLILLLSASKICNSLGNSVWV